MPSIDEVASAVAKRLSPLRAAHVERVAFTAVHLAGRHGLNVQHAELAGWLHDWCRELPGPELFRLSAEYGLLPPSTSVVQAALHGPLAARILPLLWPDLPEEVLQAIDRHTTGACGMTTFDCLIYVSDVIEPAHSFGGVEDLRALAHDDLLAATLMAMEQSLVSLLQRRKLIDARTVPARNDLLLRLQPRRSDVGGG